MAAAMEIDDEVPSSSADKGSKKRFEVKKVFTVKHIICLNMFVRLVLWILLIEKRVENVSNSKQCFFCRNLQK